MPQIIQLNRLARAQACALAGSAGQGMFLARHCINADMAIIMAAKLKTHSLCFPSHVICGTASMRPAITAPAPMLTSRAGKAQQISVPVDVNNDKKAGKDEGDFISLGIDKPLSAAISVERDKRITGFANEFFNALICKGLSLFQFNPYFSGV